MTSTVNVGFVLESGNWLGGRNYLKNLFAALHTLETPAVRTIMFVPTQQADQASAEFPSTCTVPTSLFEKGTSSWFVRRAAARLTTKDIVFQRTLRHQGISVLSHQRNKLAELGRDFPVIGWIPDFQHVHLPEFFSEAERYQRDRDFLETCRLCKTVIVSSESARNDLVAFAPGFAEKAKVLQFVASPPMSDRATSRLDLRTRYSLEEPYFLLPNQFWAHKNHRIVIAALSILKSRGRRVLILATGQTSDYRNPKAYSELMDFARSRDVLDSFKVLGVIPYNDLTGLMYNSMAILNPSRFEGWSTSVEEAKSIGMLAILSDIPVHREQAPEFAAYFHPDDAEGLADLLWTVSKTHDPQIDQNRQDRAQDQLIGRQKGFAVAYQDIVLDTLVKH